MSRVLRRVRARDTPDRPSRAGRVRHHARIGAVFLLVWALVAVPAGFWAFTHSSAHTVLASHDATVRPSTDGYATLDLGPYLPDMRYPTGGTLGADIDLGKTTADSYSELLQRYAVIGSHPAGQIRKLRSVLTGLMVRSGIAGALAGLVLPGLWVLVGRRRRRELLARSRARLSVRRVATVVGVLAVAAALVALVEQPWTGARATAREPVRWESLAEALPDVPIPERAQPVQVERGLLTSGTRRLVSSALDTYRQSLGFYRDLAEAAGSLGPRLHQPAEDEVVALLVSDRHDNIGMDKVARAIADQGDATILFDAGDDTSVGQSWETFSLDSLIEAFDGVDPKFEVAGNHDHGTFVSDYLGDHGFTTLEGDTLEGPDQIRLLGVADPRSSGLGNWRDVPGISFDQQTDRLADTACASQADGERVSTLLVHDANLGDAALKRGCVDLVLAGHLHVQVGPDKVAGENGAVGYSYTNGTTGGAAYALAIGSKLRRNAEVTLVTYRGGRPVGIQPVVIRTTGDFVVGAYKDLDVHGPPKAAGDPSDTQSQQAEPPQTAAREQRVTNHTP